MTQQLLLGMGLHIDSTFDEYYFGVNAQIHSALSLALAKKEHAFLYLWSAVGLGKSHLLQASCHLAGSLQRSSVYLPLHDLPSLSVDIFEGLEAIDVVCIDDLDALAGDKALEVALFDCYNRLRDAGKVLIVAASAAPSAVSFVLPDLVSRLSWGLVFQIKALNDDDKKAALMLHADKRGFELPDEVATYILKHSVRDNKVLFEMLEKLDYASLAEHRKLTIPFVKAVVFKNEKERD